MSVSVLYDCAEVRTFLLDHLEGRTPLAQRMLFRLHLLLCPPCRRYLARYRREAQRWQELGRSAEPPPPELVELTLKYLGTRIGPPPPPGDDSS